MQPPMRTMPNAGKLFLIPSFLGENNPAIIPAQVAEAVMPLREFIVEDARTARRYLRAIGYTANFDTEVVMHEMDKHAAQQPCAQMLKSVMAGGNCGIISEAGNPCIADPGNELVAYAHQRGVEVVPLVGPSSILLALIASGFNGQQFAFHGYLPIKEPDRSKRIKQLESAARNSTQIFMETPFRNQKLLEEVLNNCQPTTKLCIACDLTLPSQSIQTKTILQWRQTDIQLHKRYCIFLLG